MAVGNFKGKLVSLANKEPIGSSEQVTGLSSAKGLTVPAGATLALINVESQGVRWKDDGVNPTSSTGQMLNAGDYFEYDGDLTAIKFIEITASAKLNVSYYKANS